MIHQHIFASPRPGMTEAAFQDYWLNTHAVQYAAKIPQIRRYRLGMRLACSLDPAPVWNGLAEIWLENEAEQLASLQSPEFLDGARRDEPRWAAFWNTLGLDCDTVAVKPGALPEGAVKLAVLYRRPDGATPAEFRARLRAGLSAQAAALPEVLRHDLSLAREALYRVGQPRFDAIGHFWLEGPAAAEALARSPAHRVLLPETDAIVDPAQVFPMLVRETWIIGPEARP